LAPARLWGRPDRRSGEPPAVNAQPRWRLCERRGGAAAAIKR
jgi:hypothetical protein